jgi:hypothetical protein
MCAVHTTPKPLHQVALLYVSVGIEDRLSSAVSLAFVLTTFVATSIIVVELVGLEETITVDTIVFHIRFSKAWG